MVELFAHQREALQRAETLDWKCGLWMEMGTGKTRTAIVAVQREQCQRVLVVAPIAVVGVWRREAALCGLALPFVDLTQGSKASRRELLRETGDAFVIVNYETYWREPLRAQILRWRPDAVILDESQRIRHRGARQSRFAHTLADKDFVRVRLALSGTPVTNGLQDAWSQYRFIKPDLFGPFTNFQSRYISMGGWMGRQIVGYQNVEEAHERIAAHSYQCPKDLAELPARMDVPVPVRMSDKTRVVYDELKKKSIVTLNTPQPAIAIARIAITLLLRLQQVACGFVTSDDGAVVELSTEKADAAVDLIVTAKENGERCVLFARFLHDLDALQAKLPGDVKWARFDGSLSAAEKQRVLDAFQLGRYDVLLAQIRTVSLGVDLTAASIGIFYSVGFSLDEFLQAKDRLHRRGQTRPVTYYHLLAGPGTVDTRIYGALQAKLNVAQAVTDLSYAQNLFS